MKWLPYYTLWQIAEKWSRERGTSPLEIVMTLKPHLTYLEDPLLVAWPAATVYPDGEVSHMRFVELTRIQADGTTKLYNEELRAATDLLNSCEVLDAGDLLKSALSKFIIRRPDFEAWCRNAGYELPHFWFTSEDSNKSAQGKALKDTQNEKSGYNKRTEREDEWASQIINLITQNPRDYERDKGLVHQWAIDDFLKGYPDQQMVEPYFRPKSKERQRLMERVKGKLVGQCIHKGKPPRRQKVGKR